MALNDLIAASGAQLYENMRKGFVERPEEARQRGLQELQIEQERLGVQKGQAELAEYGAGADIRELQRAKQRSDLDPAVVEAQRKAAAETQQLEQDALRQGLEESRQNVRIAGTKEIDRVKAAKAADYSDLVLSAVSQKSTDDVVAYIRDNKQALLDAGRPEEDEQIKAIIAGTPEEQDRLVNILRRGQKDIIAFNQEMRKASAKGGAGGYKSPEAKQTADLQTAIAAGDMVTARRLMDEIEQQKAQTGKSKTEAAVGEEKRISNRVADEFGLSALGEAAPLTESIPGYRDVEDFVKTRAKSVGMSKAVKEIEDNFDVEYGDAPGMGTGDIPVGFTKKIPTPRVTSMDEAMKLPKGTKFIDPHGTPRVR